MPPASNPWNALTQADFHPPAAQVVVEIWRLDGLQGSLQDYESLVAAIKQVDVVISTVGSEQIADQINLIAAMKEVGTVKRFLPSEFGVDVDRDLPVDNLARELLLEEKRKIRRATKESGIPYTFVSANCFAAYFLASLGQVGYSSPPRDNVTIFGDGNAKAVFVVEDDVATYTIKAVEDPRTENKILYIRPPANILSQREAVAMWENKIGKVLEKDIMSEEELLKLSQEAPFPNNVYLALRQIIFVQGGEMFQIGSEGVEAVELYPDWRYTTANEYLDRFL